MLKAFDKALIELDGLRKIKKITDQQLEEYAAKIAILEQIVATQAEVVQKHETVGVELRAGLDSEKQALATAKKIIEDYKVELDRVRKQRDRANRLVIVAATAGIALGFFTALILGR